MALKVNLGTATTYAVLSKLAITGSAGAGSVVTGDQGISPNGAGSVTNFPPSSVVGTTHYGDAAAAAAQVDANLAYVDLSTRIATRNLSGLDLGGMVLTPGIYEFDTSAQLTGVLTLDGQGDPAATFIFQTGTTLTTASSSSVVLVNAARAGNVWWAVGSSATLGSDTTFKGSILAQVSISLTGAAGTSVDGRLIVTTASGASITFANDVTVTLVMQIPASDPPLQSVITLTHDKEVRADLIRDLRAPLSDKNMETNLIETFVNSLGGAVRNGAIDIQVDGGDAVAASGTFTGVGVVGGDFVEVNGVRFSAPVASVDLGAAEPFAVLAKSAITGSAGAGSVVTGELGISPNGAGSVTNFPPSTVVGATHFNDATAIQAQIDANLAYVDLSTRVPTQDLTGLDLGGMTLTPGVYVFSSSAQLTGTLTLDAEGDPNATFIFQTGSTLTTASSSVVALVNSANAGNVWWAVGSSATLGSDTTFKGSILAQVSISLTGAAGTSVDGRLIATTATGAAITFANDVTVTYDAQNSGGLGPNQFAIGVDDTATMANLAAAIEASVSPLIDGYVIATSALNVVTITAVKKGIYGNLISLLGSLHITASGPHATGGTDATPYRFIYGIL